MIVERIMTAKESKIQVYPVHANRASELGHECMRYLVYNRTRWSDKLPHDARLQLIFDIGNTLESMVISDLMEAGFVVTEQQRPFSWDKYNITGRVDCKILTADKVYPCEIKSSAPNVFNSINTIDDMRNHKYHYMRKYPAQLTLYMLMSSQDLGVFIFKNKSTGELKEIWMELDYVFAESLIQKAETINDYIKRGELPDQIEYDDNICGQCAFEHICTPDRIGTEVDIDDNENLIELVDRWNALKPTAKEFEDVDKALTKMVLGREKVLAGDFYIEGKWQTRKSYNIPDEVKASYEVEPTPYWKKKVIPLQSGNVADEQ